MIRHIVRNEEDMMDSNIYEEKNLSACEAVIMKAIWNAGEDIAFLDLMSVLKNQFGKDYSRTTVSTFLARLAGKNYVVNYRKGRTAYIHALKSEDEYKRKLIAEEAAFWYDGRLADFVCALCSTQKLSREDVDLIREMLDGMDD